MAPKVIDLISSSPPDAGRPSRAPERPRKVDASTANRLSDGFLFLSDDFDDTIDLEEPVLTTTGNKRRISPQNDNRPEKRPSPAFPRVQHATKPPAVADPIDLTSSPTWEEIPAPKPSNCRGTSKSRSVPELSPDPFASTPPPQTSIPQSSGFSQPKRTTTRAKSFDPFASSPRPTVHQKPARPVYLGETTGPSRPKRNNDWDPISSSAPESRSFDSPPRNPVVIDIDDSDDSNAEDSDEFPDIANFDVARQRRVLHRSQSEVTVPKSKPRPKQTIPQKPVADQAREREVKAAAKEAAKENKRREKQQAKEAKAREKERAAALAEVNKVRTDKKVSTPEMLVDIPTSLDITTKTQLEAYLEGLDVQFTCWDSPVGNVVKWRRKVKSQYNDDLGLWEPVPLRIQDEKHVLVVMTADEFVKLALEDDLEVHVAKMIRHFGSHQIIYLLEGLVPWMRKNRNARNRQFTSRVRSQDASQSRRTNATDYVPEETIEDAILQLQLMHDVLIHHTTIPMETAHWISAFTQHVSTVPYRNQKDQATLGAGFCMESGQVKTGEDKKDTYVRLLQEIVRVTGPIAHGIVAEFPNVGELVQALETEGPSRLEGVRKSANKDGAFSDRTIGQAVSRRIHKVFTGRDEGSTDV
ncbi:ERCC4 domain-containing protein [Thelonectria olida]|uniref:ERCC4 domain-containing protein n=1 Tax=Thelonectria olida TaxID=1576542 RepID=A0A9P8WFL2_9HYPO|nr:ERCC4 domain-containing protein [Thelonectria olida]